MSTDEQPARANVATLLKYLHDERMANAARPGREDRPVFNLKRSTASGSLGAMAFDFTVPVCEEYPTSEDAFNALLDYTQRAEAMWPVSTNGGAK